MLALFVVYGGYTLWNTFVAPKPVIQQPAVSETKPVPKPKPVPEPKPQPAPEKNDYDYNPGELIVTPERLEYKDGDMSLSIPEIGIDSIPVLNLPNPDKDGEDAVNSKLNEGVGLFFCAQMPGTGNPNVSIAGHRDIYGSEFLHLDKLTEGSKIYLEYNGKRFEYEYVDTVIIDPNDAPEVIWKPMMTKDFSAITLQTCEPVWVASHRMFITGKLVSIDDLS